MGEFEGRVVIVTGGGLGIGPSYCRGFGEAGAHVVAADMDEASATRVAQDVEGLAVRVDVSDETSTKAMAMAARDRFGRIDILVNNAGLLTAILPMKPWTEISVEEWDRVMAVNVRGYLLCARAVFPHMKERRWGRIINIGSNTSMSGVPGFLHYVTSKGAIVGLTRALAREIGETGITVNTVTPGLVLTEGIKKHYSEETLESRVAARSIKRHQMPEDLVGAVMFLASEGAGFITGQILNVDGGQIMH
jgi:NAD(P)-dependent dehydrogenase (short-subunit alcohol dehydrogenase family)